MDYEYEMSQGDFVKAVRCATASSGSAKLTWTALCAGALLASASFPRLLPPVLGGVCGLAAFWAWYHWGALPLIARNQYRSGPMFRSKTTLSLDDRGLRFRSEIHETFVGWEAIARWRESAECLLVYVSALSYLPVPKGSPDAARLLEPVTEALRARVGAPS